MTARYGVFDDIAWHDTNSGGATHAVATKLPNALGLYDTIGNDLEWCQDWYGPYASGGVTNPTGPTTGTVRLLRGCSWYDYSARSRASLRHNYPSFGFTYAVGFRVVRNP